MDRQGVRLAELVAALSLGIDLGFGQPMEHVLRQCLIALRTADSAGLDEGQRVAVYYTALLINVGCHTDAHEQAKWFGDDIALKSGKYDYEFKSLRGAAAMLGRIGTGAPALQRFRVGLEFAVSGHKDLSGMIAQHRTSTPHPQRRRSTRRWRVLSPRSCACPTMSSAHSARPTSSGTGTAGRAG